MRKPTPETTCLRRKFEEKSASESSVPNRTHPEFEPAISSRSPFDAVRAPSQFNQLPMWRIVHLASIDRWRVRIWDSQVHCSLAASSIKVPAVLLLGRRGSFIAEVDPVAAVVREGRAKLGVEHDLVDVAALDTKLALVLLSAGRAVAHELRAVPPDAGEFALEGVHARENRLGLCRIALSLVRNDADFCYNSVRTGSRGRARREGGWEVHDVWAGSALGDETRLSGEVEWEEDSENCREENRENGRYCVQGAGEEISVPGCPALGCSRSGRSEILDILS